MNITIDRPKTPEPPVDERGGGGGGRRVVLLPAVVNPNPYHVTRHEGVATVFFHFVARYDTASGDVKIAETNTRVYRQWLECYDLSETRGIPPHIWFGGADEDVEITEKMIDEWIAFVKKTFVC